MAALLSSLAATPVAAERLWIAQFAPTIAEPVEIRIAVDGASPQVHTLAYGTTAMVEAALPATVTLEARHPDGTVIATSTRALAATDHVIPLAGVPQGTNRTALGFYFGARRPDGGSEIEIETASVSVAPSGGDVASLAACGTYGPPRAGLEDVWACSHVSFGEGFSVPHGRRAGRLYGDVCKFALKDRTAVQPGRPIHEAPSLVEREVPCAVGDRLWATVIGDGVNAPLDINLIDLGETTANVTPPVLVTTEMTGLWSIEGEPGAGLTLSLQQEGGRDVLHGMLYAYRGGEPEWQYLTSRSPRPSLAGMFPVQLARFEGGSSSGEHGAVAFAHASAMLTFVSCDRAVLDGYSAPALGLGGNDGFGRPLILRRLLPTTPCTTVTQGDQP